MTLHPNIHISTQAERVRVYVLMQGCSAATQERYILPHNQHADRKQERPVGDRDLSAEAHAAGTQITGSITRSSLSLGLSLSHLLTG